MSELELAGAFLGVVYALRRHEAEVTHAASWTPALRPPTTSSLIIGCVVYGVLGLGFGAVLTRELA